MVETHVEDVWGVPPHILESYSDEDLLAALWGEHVSEKGSRFRYGDKINEMLRRHGADPRPGRPTDPDSDFNFGSLATLLVGADPAHLSRVSLTAAYYGWEVRAQVSKLVDVSLSHFTVARAKVMRAYGVDRHNFNHGHVSESVEWLIRAQRKLWIRDELTEAMDEYFEFTTQPSETVSVRRDDLQAVKDTLITLQSIDGVDGDLIKKTIEILEAYDG